MTRKKKTKITERQKTSDIPDFTGEDFEASVKELHFDKNKALSRTRKKKMSRGENIFQISLIAVFAIIFIVCAVMLTQNISDKIKSKSIYKEVQDNFDRILSGEANDESLMYASLLKLPSDSPMQTLYSRLGTGKTDSSTGGTASSQFALLSSELSSCRDQNSDVYGYIYIEGTRIHYPIVRGSDNDFYLNHVYTKVFSTTGAIFADFSTKDLITDNYNTMIYGHNLEDGHMFHDVTKFLQKDFFDNTNIIICTMDGIFTYKPVAIYETTSDYDYYRTEFANDASFVKYANELLANSKYDAGIQFVPGDTMITLSTCTNGTTQTGRYALHAKLIEKVTK